AIDSATRRSSSDGDSTRIRKTAVTISSKSQLRTTFRRSSALPLADLFRIPAADVLVRIQIFLRRTQSFGDVLEVDPDARPCVEASAHRVDQHVCRLQVRRRFGMPRLPPLESFERTLFFFGSADFDQRKLPPALFELRRDAPL